MKSLFTLKKIFLHRYIYFLLHNLSHERWKFNCGIQKKFFLIQKKMCIYIFDSSFSISSVIFIFFFFFLSFLHEDDLSPNDFFPLLIGWKKSFFFISQSRRRKKRKKEMIFEKKKRVKWQGESWWGRKNEEETKFFQLTSEKLWSENNFNQKKSKFYSALQITHERISFQCCC